MESDRQEGTVFSSLNKVGGSHLNSIKAFEKVRDLFDPSLPQLIIVSALGKTTSKLQGVLDAAAVGVDHQVLLGDILGFHRNLAIELGLALESFAKFIEQDVEQLSDILLEVNEARAYTKVQQDHVLSMGEFWSCFLFGEFWGTDYQILDASKIVVIDKIARRNIVDWQASQNNLRDILFSKTKTHFLITGFIAQDRNGKRLTLGFEGSDFSAAIFAYLFNVSSVTFWSDVDGLFSADPTLVSQARIIPELSYQEAKELAYLGSSILHPQTIEPLMKMQIPVYLRNAYKTTQKFTTIQGKTKAGVSAVRGISIKQGISLINIEGSGTLDANSLAVRALGALQAGHIPVLLNTQASSSHSLCLAVQNEDLQQANETLLSQFYFELKEKILLGVGLQTDCAMLAIVGEAMAGEVGCCAQLLRCLAKANINVLALSQGASERNISVVVDAKQSVKAINVIHAGAYLSKRQIHIGLIGPGNVGRVFLEQLLENKVRLEQELGVCFHLKGVASSQKMVFLDSAENVQEVMEQLSQQGETYTLTDFIKQLKPQDLTHTVIIDCTASEEISEYYQMIIDHGFHIITPNKKVTSGADLRFQAVKGACRAERRYFLYETNVCAGLPVIKTLQDLIATGDVIEKIQGVFSGTLSYLFNAMGNGSSFSKALLSAYQHGFTEPDPRDDLKGMDVARKCVCLAREMGMKLELSNVNIAPILPESLMNGSVEEFLSRTDEMDQVFDERLQMLSRKGMKLVYRAQINQSEQVKLSIDEISDDDPFYHLKGTDNMVVFKSQRYSQYPLVIQGPGAGADVTAAGVFADLLRLVSLTSGE